MKMLTVMALLLMSLNASGQARPQTERCNTDCVRTVRELIRAQRLRVELSWLEKENQRLGDSASVALRKIFGPNRINEPQNIETFLPIIRAAFLYPSLISDSDNKVPTFTLPLLQRLKEHARDPNLKKKIADLFDFISAEQSRASHFRDQDTKAPASVPNIRAASARISSRPEVSGNEVKKICFDRSSSVYLRDLTTGQEKLVLEKFVAALSPSGEERRIN